MFIAFIRSCIYLNLHILSALFFNAFEVVFGAKAGEHL